MRKDRLYFLTFLSIAVIFMIISSFAIGYFVEVSANKILQTQLDFSKREVEQIGDLLSYQLENGTAKDTIRQHLQHSIQGSNLESGFISLFDWSGRIICHPDIKQVGSLASQKSAFTSSMAEGISSEQFYSHIIALNDLGTPLVDAIPTNQGTEVVYLYPVKNSDWIIAAHANMDTITHQIADLRDRFYIILLVMGFVMILLSVITVRYIGGTYERRLEVRNQKLSDEVVNLSKLNRAVGDYQQKVIDREPWEEKEGGGQKRILTYYRNELVPIPIEEIAHIYTENSITYVVCADGSRSTSNLSLDQLLSNLDSTYFYRANRKTIIAITAIEKIVKYGNNQLKILVNPNAEVDIIISKNRAAEFKQWLNL